jgi:hypothetical protein
MINIMSIWQTHVSGMDKALKRAITTFITIRRPRELEIVGIMYIMRASSVKVSLLVRMRQQSSTNSSASV